MTVTLDRPSLSGSIPAIASKSHIHRLIIAAALYAGTTTVKYSGSLSDDINATVSCIRALGAETDVKENEITVKCIPRDALNKEPYALYCGESGSTLRFMLPVVCALGVCAEFYPEGRLPQRPLSPLREELIRHGCRISEPGSVPLKVSGILEPGDFTINGGVSSQYITGLLTALPVSGVKSSIIITGRLESRPYIDMTLDVLSEFGINITEDGNMFTIESAPQVCRAAGNNTFCADGDWSNAAFWLCAGAIGKHPVGVTGLSERSKQGDKAVIEILERFGAEIHRSENEIRVFPSTLRGIEIDASDIPDLVPVLALTAACAEGRTLIYGASRLKLKESDRLEAVSQLLSGLGADIAATDDSLIINGVSSRRGFSLKGGCADSRNDHRIAMTAAIASCVSENSVTIKDAQAVRKSYPGFWDDLEKLNNDREC